MLCDSQCKRHMYSCTFILVFYFWKNLFYIIFCKLSFSKGGSLIATSMVLGQSPDPVLCHQLYTLLPWLLLFYIFVLF